MVPPMDPEKLRAMMKNPYALDMIEKDMELLRLQRRRKEEEECVHAPFCTVNILVEVVLMLYY